MYLSRLLEMQKAVDAVSICSPLQAKYLSSEARVARTRDLEKTGNEIANSCLWGDDKLMLLESIEISKANLQYACNAGTNNASLKYLLVALASGGLGFGLGWKAKGMYEDGKAKDAKELAGMILENLKDAGK